MHLSELISDLVAAMDKLEQQQPGWHIELQNMVSQVDDMLEAAGSRLRKSRTGRAATARNAAEAQPAIPDPTTDRAGYLAYLKQRMH